MKIDYHSPYECSDTMEMHREHYTEQDIIMEC